MRNNKTSTNTQARMDYEPVMVKVMKVTPQGVLCASSGPVSSPTQFKTEMMSDGGSL